MAVEALIEVRSISKYFGSVIALKDISMICYQGEVMCLLGDNGAGKSGQPRHARRRRRKSRRRTEAQAPF